MWWAWLIPVVLALVAFWPTLDNGWVLDDHSQLIRNRLIQEPQFYLRAICTDVWSFCDPFARPTSNYWRPTFVAWNILNHAAWGLESPRPWHATNLALHITTTLLAFVLAVRLELGSVGATLSATLFALHPTRLEPVAWIAGAADLLLGLWVTLAMLAWVLRVQARGSMARWGWSGAACIAYALALGSKEAALGLPLVMAVYHIEHRRRTDAHADDSITRHAVHALPALVPLAIVAVAWFITRWQVLGGFLGAKPTATPWQTILTLPSTLRWYIMQTLWPHPISPVYLNDIVQPPVLGLHDFWLPLGIVLVTAGVTFAAWRASWRWAMATKTGHPSTREQQADHPGRGQRNLPNWALARSDLGVITSVGIAQFGVILLPAMNIGAYSFNQPVHDRYLHTPHIGLSMVIAAWLLWALGEWASRGRSTQACVKRGRASLTAIALVMIAFSASSASALRGLAPFWRNETTTWTWGLRVEPRSAMAHSTLAMAAYNEGRFEDALRHVDLADQFTLDKPVVIKEGEALAGGEPGAPTLATEPLKEEQWRDSVRANLLRAQIYLDTGRNKDAALEYETFIRVVRASVEERSLSLIRAALAVAYTRLNRLPEAEALLRRCKELSPEFSPIIIERLSVVVFKAGRQDEALALLEAELPNVEACHLHGRQLVYYRLGSLYYMRGRFAEARTQFEKFLSSTVAIENRAMARYRAETEKALRDLDRLQRSPPPVQSAPPMPAPAAPTDTRP